MIIPPRAKSAMIFEKKMLSDDKFVLRDYFDS